MATLTRPALPDALTAFDVYRSGAATILRCHPCGWRHRFARTSLASIATTALAHHASCAGLR